VWYITKDEGRDRREAAKTITESAWQSLGFAVGLTKKQLEEQAQGTGVLPL